MKAISNFSVLFFVFLCFCNGNAQETSIAFDSSGKIEVIDAELEKRLQLFSDYEIFHEARLYQISNSNFVLEIFYQPADKILKARNSLTFQEVSELRHKVDSLVSVQAPQALLNQSGRVKLIAGTTLVGLGFYGWAVPVSLDASRTGAVVSLYLLTSAASFFISYASTLHSSVTDAAATMALYGETRGIAHGLMIGYLFSGEAISAQGAVGAALLTSVAEGYIGYSLATHTKMSDGKAVAIGVGGDFGIGIGAAAAEVFGYFEEDHVREATGTMLVGSAAGLIAGNILANNHNYTRGDGYVLRDIGLLGAGLGLSIADMAEGSNKSIAAASMVGAIGGLGLADHLLRDKDFSKNDGMFISLAELGGGLCGLGAAYIIDDNAKNNSLYWALATVGGTAGFLLMYDATQKHARISNKKTSWNLDIAPEGLFTLAMSDKMNSRISLPFVRMNVKF